MSNARKRLEECCGCSADVGCVLGAESCACNRERRAWGRGRDFAVMKLKHGGRARARLSNLCLQPHTLIFFIPKVLDQAHSECCPSSGINGHAGRGRGSGEKIIVQGDSINKINAHLARGCIGRGRGIVGGQSLLFFYLLFGPILSLVRMAITIFICAPISIIKAGALALVAVPTVSDSWRSRCLGCSYGLVVCRQALFIRMRLEGGGGVRV